MEDGETTTESEIREEQITSFRVELELDWEALSVAFENQLPESHSYLDLRNGKVHTVISTDGRIPDPPEPTEAHLYIRPRPSREGYRTMQRFIETVQEPDLRERLAAALVGKGAFRRFKDQLLNHPEVRQQWFAFKDAEVYAYIWNWLGRERIKALNEPPSSPSKERFAVASIRGQADVLTEGGDDVRRDPIPMGDPDEEAGEWRDVIADYDRPETVFRPARSALLVIDMQNVFADPDGSTYLPMSASAGERLAGLVEACRLAGVPVVFTRHVHQDPQQDGGAMARWWRSLILEGSRDAEIVEALTPREGERVITKCRYSAFAGTPLEMVLRSMGIEDVIIGGVMTNLCCETTARDAFVRDFNVFFLADGTATVSESLHHATLGNIAYGFGRVLGCSDARRLLEASSPKLVQRIK
jgi:nicotinamidase-related amidase